MRDPRLARLLPPEVVTVVATPEMYQGPVRSEESHYLTPMRDGRRREFTAGRVAARIAMAVLGVTDWPLTRDDDRVPRWPRELVGSLTHCEGFCGVAVARRRDVAGLGLDCEPARPLSPDLPAQIAAPDELDLAAGVAAEPSLAGVRLFTAKEAFYKSWFPITREHLGFHEVFVRSLDGDHFLVELPQPLASRWDHGPEITGRWALFDGLVCSAVAIPPNG